MNYGYIYCTTNIINNKKYIGKKVSSKFNPKYLGSGILITNAITKYGTDKFIVELLEWCSSNDDLNNREKYYINKFNAYKSDVFYNIAMGGEGGNTYAGKTEEELIEIKRKISNANKGERNGNKGQYKGVLNSMYGKKHSMDTRLKISESLKKNNYNRSHAWTDDKNNKRNETITRYISLWRVVDKSNNQTYLNFTNKIVWIKTLFPEIYNSISKLEKLQLYREGFLLKNDIEIYVQKVDTKSTPTDLLHIYQKYHSDYKVLIYNRYLERMKKYRSDKKSNKV